VPQAGKPDMVSFARINPTPLTTFDRPGNPAAGRDRVRGRLAEPPGPSSSCRPPRPPGQGEGMEKTWVASPGFT